MEIYFVRHGETGGNVARRHQAENTQLTKRGLEQAAAVALLIQKEKPTHILSSTMVRTLETARIIGDVCDVIPDTSSHFVEIGRPPRLHGYHFKSLPSLWYYTRWFFGLTESLNDGGESYRALRERIERAKEQLQSYPQDARIVVVSHAVFISFFVTHMCDKRPIGLFRAVSCFIRILRTKNGSITKIHLNHQSPKGTCSFTLLS